MQPVLIFLAVLSSALVVSCQLRQQDRELDRERQGGSSFEREFLERPEFRHDHRQEHDQEYKQEYNPDRMIDYFVKNPVTKRERQCFESKLSRGDSVDFIIDLAPSPSMDKVDRISANSPIGVFLEKNKWSGSTKGTGSTYFDAIQVFIDLVTYGMKPELTHSIILGEDKRTKFYLRGRFINDTLDIVKLGGELGDPVRNLKTMWPASTQSRPDNKMSRILSNNLGHMTKLALKNRDNGLPTVLSTISLSKSTYSIVLTDGSSGASLRDLVGHDISRTTVIDLANHRFVDRLKWEEIERIRGGVFTLPAPQTLPSLANSVRTMACWLASNRDVSGGQQIDSRVPDYNRPREGHQHLQQQQQQQFGQSGNAQASYSAPILVSRV